MTKKVFDNWAKAEWEYNATEVIWKWHHTQAKQDAKDVSVQVSPTNSCTWVNSANAPEQNILSNTNVNKCAVAVFQQKNNKEPSIFVMFFPEEKKDGGRWFVYREIKTKYLKEDIVPRDLHQSVSENQS